MQPKIKIIFAGCRLIAFILNAKHRRCVTHLSDGFRTCESNDKWASGRLIVQVHQRYRRLRLFYRPKFKLRTESNIKSERSGRLSGRLPIYLFLSRSAITHNKDYTHLLSSGAYAIRRLVEHETSPGGLFIYSSASPAPTYNLRRSFLQKLQIQCEFV